MRASGRAVNRPPAPHSLSPTRHALWRAPTLLAAGYLFSRMTTRRTAPATILDLPPAVAAARLAGWCQERSLPAFRARQLLPYLWARPLPAWEDATDLPRSLREQLQADWPLPRLDLAQEQISSDGTRKFLWRLADGEAIESVLIPSGERRTLCI